MNYNPSIITYVYKEPEILTPLICDFGKWALHTCVHIILKSLCQWHNYNWTTSTVRWNGFRSCWMFPALWWRMMKHTHTHTHTHTQTHTALISMLCESWTIRTLRNPQYPYFLACILLCRWLLVCYSLVPWYWTLLVLPMSTKSLSDGSMKAPIPSTLN